MYLFADSIKQPFTSHHSLFPENKSFHLSSCQKWTEQVRNFQIKKEKKANHITILNYHKIIDDQHINDTHYDHTNKLYSTIVLKSEFEQQMAFLKQQQFTTLTATELALFMKNKLEIPQNSVVITFDDGFKNTYYEAYPILKKYNFTAINFLITGYITEKDSKFEPAGTQYLSLSDIQKGCDIFDYQLHTYNFHHKNKKDQSFLVSKPKQDIIRDLRISLHNLNKEQPLFAYPYGEYNKSAIDILKTLNITMAFTVEKDNARPSISLYKIPRNVVLPNLTLDEFKKLINL